MMKKYFLMVILVGVFVFSCSFVNFKYKTKPYMSGKINSCSELFEIGYSQLDKSYLANLIDKLKLQKLKLKQITENYIPLFNYLPSLVTEEDGHLKIQNRTRLEILNGKLPYIGCQMHLYMTEEIQDCLQIRKDIYNETYIAFLGDSKMRNAAEYIVLETSSFLQWPPHIIQFISKKDNERNRQQTWIADSDKGLKIHYIFAPNGGMELDALTSERITELKSWTNGTIVPPTVVVIDYGLWEMITGDETVLSRLDNAYQRWERNKDLLQKLSKTSMVLILAQSRARESTLMYLQNFDRRHQTSETLRITQKKNIIGSLMKAPYSEVLDWVKAYHTYRIGATFWDTTLPFNLLSDAECQLIIKHNVSILYSEFAQHKGYRKHMCHDDVHRSKSTIKDEMTMLWNLMCNQYLPKTVQRCCQ